MQGRRADRALEQLLAFAVAAGGAWIALSTLRALPASHWAGPAVDFWKFVPILEALEGGEPIAGDLLRAHGGHRLLVPRLLYLLEYRFFDGTNAFLIGCSVALQAAVLALLARGAWRERARLSAPVAVFSTGFGAALLFSGTQLENLSRAWHVHWFLAYGASAGALLALARAPRARGRGAWSWLALALALAAVSTWSMAIGVLAPPLLLLTAAGLRLPARWLAPFALGALAVAGSFFVGHAPGPELRGAALAREPLARLLYTAGILGAPLSWEHPLAGRALGLAGMLAAVALWVRFLAGRMAPRPVEVAHLGLLLFALGAALLTAAGRLPHSETYWALRRYQTTALYFWWSLIALALFRCTPGDGRLRRARQLRMGGAAAWLFLVLLPAHRDELRDVAAAAERIRTANLAIAVGIADRASYEPSLPHTDRRSGRDHVARHAPFLRARGLGMFAGGATRLLGLRVGRELATAEPERCRGRVTGVEPLGGGAAGLRLSGRAWDRRRDAPPHAILMADGGGLVIGLGLALAHGAAERGSAPLPTDAADWVAFARPPATGAALHAWALLDGRLACRIPPPVAVDSWRPGG